MYEGTVHVDIQEALSRGERGRHQRCGHPLDIWSPVPALPGVHQLLLELGVASTGLPGLPHGYVAPVDND